MEKIKWRKLERWWGKSKLHVDHQLYKDQCERVRCLVKSAKINFYSSVILNNASNKSQLFSTVDRLLHRSVEKQFPSCTSTYELCNNFSDYFIKKINSIRAELPCVTDTTFLSLCTKLDNPRFYHSLEHFSPVTIREMSGLIHKFSAKSCDLDLIPAQLLTKCFDHLLTTSSSHRQVPTSKTKT